MPGAYFYKGYGWTLTMATSTYPASMKLRKWEWTGASRPVIEKNHMGLSTPGSGKVGNAEFEPGGVIDPGGLDVEFFWNPGVTPPMKEAAETVTLTAPTITGDSTGASIAGSGFMYDIRAGVSTDEGVTFNAKIKFTGNVTVTAAT